MSQSFFLTLYEKSQLFGSGCLMTRSMKNEIFTYIFCYRFRIVNHVPACFIVYLVVLVLVSAFNTVLYFLHSVFARKSNPYFEILYFCLCKVDKLKDGKVENNKFSILQTYNPENVDSQMIVVSLLS